MAVTAPSTPTPTPTPATAPAPAAPCRARHAGRPPRRPAAPHPPHVWFAERLLGVLTGARAITCLAGHVHADTYDSLWHLAGARTDWRHRPGAGRAPALHRCRAVLVAEDILEVTAVVALAADRFRAIAFRLERRERLERLEHLEHREHRERPSGATASSAGNSAGGWRLTAVEAR